MKDSMQKAASDPAQVRRGRIFLSVLGSFLVLVVLYLGFDGAGVIGYGTLGLGLFGALLLVIAAFASDRLVNAMQTLLTGWP
ncbi:MAG: hypothetical protein ABIP08_05685 [Lautropia sp.]